MSEQLKEEKTYSPYWLNVFKKMCPQSSIEEWEGIPFLKVAKAAENGDETARQAIFWQMKNIIEAFYAKNKAKIYAWSNELGLTEKSEDVGADVNEMALNWISVSWTAIFDGYPLSDDNTIGPFIKYVRPGRELDYLTWIYFKKIGNLLYYMHALDRSTGLTKNNGVNTISANLYADKRKDNAGQHSIKREIIDDWQSENDIPEEEFALVDNLRAFKAFARDPELNEKKHGFSPMIAFKAIVLNAAKGENAESNMANIASKYNVSRNTFAAYAQKAADTLRDKYEVSLSELQALLKRYGPESLGRVIQESKFMPKPLNKLFENCNFKLLESLFTGKESLKESEYPDRVAECPCCGHIFKETDYADYTCPECGEFFDVDDLNFKFEDDEFQDGASDTHIDNILDDLSESTNLKEHENPFAKIAAELCRRFTKDIDFDNDDNAMTEAADRLVEFIDSLIEQSMEYFPVDVYEPDLYKIWEEHEKRHK